MKKSITHSVIGALLLVQSASAATLVVANSDFTAVTGGNPSSWTTVETTGEADSLYVQAAANSAVSQGNVAHFKDGIGNATSLYIQQSITANNAGVFADTYSSFTVTLDLGWRGDLNDRNDASFRISLFNTTDNIELAFQDVAFPVRATGAADNYQLIQDNAAFLLSYDNTFASYAGDTIEVRIARTDADTTAAGANFNSTAWIDDVRLTAVPEPSAILLGALGAFGLLRRRR